jgi:methionine-rich copper-binding protein CopC
MRALHGLLGAFYLQVKPMPFKSLPRIALSTLCLLSPSVWAHAHLLSQAPAANATVTAPHVIELVFSEAIEPNFSQVSLSRATGEAMATQPLQVNGSDHKTLLLELDAPLAAGDYTVTWRVRSVDTHKSAGSYRFTVGR